MARRMTIRAAAAAGVAGPAVFTGAWIVGSLLQPGPVSWHNQAHNVVSAVIYVDLVAASRLGRWDAALNLNAAQTARMRDRGAPATVITRARFNDYGALLRLGRTGEAPALLLECRQVFQDAHDIQGLGGVLSALADAENQRGHGDAAIRMERDALRYEYLAGDVIAITASYHHLGFYLRCHAGQPGAVLAGVLTADLIGSLTGAGGVGDLVRAAATDLREFGADATPPEAVAEQAPPDLTAQALAAAPSETDPAPPS